MDKVRELERLVDISTALVRQTMEAVKRTEELQKALDASIVAVRVWEREVAGDWLERKVGRWVGRFVAAHAPTWLLNYAIVAEASRQPLGLCKYCGATVPLVPMANMQILQTHADLRFADVDHHGLTLCPNVYEWEATP